LILAEIAYAYAAITIALVVIVAALGLLGREELPPGSSAGILGLAIVLGLLTWGLTFPHVVP